MKLNGPLSTWAHKEMNDNYKVTRDQENEILVFEGSRCREKSLESLNPRTLEPSGYNVCVVENKGGINGFQRIT